MLDVEYYEALLFRGRYAEDGTVWQIMVDRWPRMTWLDVQYLAQPDGACWARDGDLVTFRVANGEATYELVERDETRMSYRARLVSARLSDGISDG